MVGQMVPFKVLGFSSSLELLQACSEAVEIQNVEGGHTLLLGKPTDQQLDMARMVANQREECRGYDYRTGEVLKNQSHATKKNLEKVSGERKRQVTPFLKEQVGKMMELEEHQAGLELGIFWTPIRSFMTTHWSLSIMASSVCATFFAMGCRAPLTSNLAAEVNGWSSLVIVLLHPWQSCPPACAPKSDSFWPHDQMALRLRPCPWCIHSLVPSTSPLLASAV